MEWVMKSYDKVFVTGCDKNTEWQLEWFLKNFKKHNKTIPIVFANFGVSDEKREWIYKVSAFDDIIDIPKQRMNGWFLKPKTLNLIDAHKLCWLDTDCEVLENVEDIWNHCEPDKLGMCEDRPWSKRSGEKWFNSGVMAIIDKPRILGAWIDACAKKPKQGDQEVLHFMMVNPINQITHISQLPHMYNWLRIDVEHDSTDSVNKRIMHWTGEKGNNVIRKKIYNG
jgi:hypothetical protein